MRGRAIDRDAEGVTIQCPPPTDDRPEHHVNKQAVTLPDRSRAAGVDRIRVASVPSQHVYVAHLSHPAADDGVLRLPDPRPDVDVPLVGQWWPPAMLSPTWIAEHRDEFDVFHIQFGFDAQNPDDLRQIVDELAAHEKPLVYTVHDLRNPHHHDRAAHDAHLDVLIPAATALITLTAGAASTIRGRWGREAHVLAHPHVVDFPRMRAERPERDTFVVGVHAKSLRASMDPGPVIGALCTIVRELPGARLRVNVHRDVFEREGLSHSPAFAAQLTEAAARQDLEFLVHDCYTDDELWDYLQALDVSVLPYRFGTHSGWLEACYDLGTTVIAPTCGFFAEQRPCLSYRHGEDGLDVDSLREAVITAYEQRPSWRADSAGRWLERSRLAAAHQQIYSHALA